MLSRLSRPAIKLSSIMSKSGININMSQFVLFSTDATRGAPPVSIDDLYGLYFLSEPEIKGKDREPQDMFNNDQRINEVMIYTNGGLHACNDDTNASFVRHMFEAAVVFGRRDAGRRPPLREILKQEGYIQIILIYIYLYVFEMRYRVL